MAEEIEDIDTRRKQLRQFAYSPIGRYYIGRLQENRDNAWKEFIALPTDKKTSKAAYNASAKYKVYQEEIDWISHEANMAS